MISNGSCLEPAHGANAQHEQPAHKRQAVSVIHSERLRLDLSRSLYHVTFKTFLVSPLILGHCRASQKGLSLRPTLGGLSVV